MSASNGASALWTGDPQPSINEAAPCLDGSVPLPRGSSGVCVCVRVCVCMYVCVQGKEMAY